MRINLGNTPLFRGMTVPDIEEMLCCLRAAERSFSRRMMAATGIGDYTAGR